MAVRRCKGTKLQLKIATVFTDIGQLLSFELPEAESETMEIDTLDNATAGIPYAATGRIEGGTLSGEIFYDPKLAVHKSLLSVMTTTDVSEWKITFVTESPAPEWTFSTVGMKFGGSVGLKDGLKAKFSAKVTGVVTYPA